MFKNFSWGHGVVVALGSFILFILFLIFIFPNGQTNSELITEHYYEDELKYQEVIDAKKRADELPVKPIYRQDANGIRIEFPEGFDASSSKVNFYLYRVNNALLDIRKEVELDARRGFQIPSKVLVKGSYTLKLYFEKKGVNYQIDYNVEWK